MNFTKYKVVTSDDFGKFEDRVNQLLGDGWQLQGGVSTSALPDSNGSLVHVQWSQALVLPQCSASLEAIEEAEEPGPLDLESNVLPHERSGSEPAASDLAWQGMPTARKRSP